MYLIILYISKVVLRRKNINLVKKLNFILFNLTKSSKKYLFTFLICIYYPTLTELKKIVYLTRIGRYISIRDT